VSVGDIYHTISIESYVLKSNQMTDCVDRTLCRQNNTLLFTFQFLKPISPVYILPYKAKKLQM
jgi:hypothetical protein